jgi:hypothetical protein
MGSKAQAKASSENAKRMKEKGIRRETSQCLMGCGRQIKNGGSAMILHLGRCTGKN